MAGGPRAFEGANVLRVEAYSRGNQPCHTFTIHGSDCVGNGSVADANPPATPPSPRRSPSDLDGALADAGVATPRAGSRRSPCFPVESSVRIQVRRELHDAETRNLRKVAVVGEKRSAVSAACGGELQRVSRCDAGDLHGVVRPPGADRVTVPSSEFRDSVSAAARSGVRAVRPLSDTAPPEPRAASPQRSPVREEWRIVVKQAHPRAVVICDAALADAGNRHAASGVISRLWL